MGQERITVETRPPEIKKRRHRQGAGFTIPGFAEHYNLPVSQVRLAVKRREINTVTWAGLERIPPAEAERVAELFGLRPRDDPS
ncbi:hypothetical protein [Bradyrhizobium japonicum]|uniref:hypothetical protein n=1 Tax=Bradyrhizobium japonicum TaxID=375 RepID=UPI001E490AD7|nr:hypothetical protein [Bradyrhizobium japonicum]MCD9821147.1 hypothetical protein [Bradyrhizobium japonicum]MEB2674156.1 hypothetical protein [Bradyrhizobium japonicum]WRI93342.1 hypothetical protein R3F75_21360 [Bradyrhizobium japonicum]